MAEHENLKEKGLGLRRAFALCLKAFREARDNSIYFFGRNYQKEGEGRK
jgi:hypothetical protein